MQLTPKLREALQLAAGATNHRLIRCCGGFRPQGQFGKNPVVTRRTANVLRNAMLADFNNPTIPSALTLTPKGIALAQSLLAGDQPAKAAA